MRSPTEIIQSAGGTQAIAARTGQTAWAVAKWPRNGIPEKHWAAIRDLCPEITVEELHAANESIRAAGMGRLAMVE